MICSRLLLAIVCTGTVSLVACSSQPGAEDKAKMQDMSQMDHSQMDHGQMDHGQMDHGQMNHGDMGLGPKDDAFDLRFIDGMRPHHEGAVVMAEEALAKSKRPEIITLSKAIIAAQAAEIGQMEAWRKAWYSEASDEAVMWDEAAGKTVPMSEDMRSAMMMSGSLGAADDGFDQRFIAAMTPHHEGALMMAKEALEKSDRPEVQQMAAAILSSQQAEIDQMQQWQTSWYGQ